MKQAKILFKVLILFAFIAVLSACGKMSDPKPIEGSGYAHTYPKN